MYSLSYYRNREPFDKDEMKKLIATTIVSIVLLGLAILYQQLWLALPSGLVSYICLWLFFGNALSKSRRNRENREIEKLKELYGEDYLNNPEYLRRACGWKVGK